MLLQYRGWCCLPSSAPACFPPTLFGAASLPARGSNTPRCLEGSLQFHASLRAWELPAQPRPRAAGLQRARAQGDIAAHPKGSLGTRKNGSRALRIPEQDPSALTSSCHLPSSATNEQERVWGPARVSSCLNFSHAERTARELRGTRHRGPEAAPVGSVFRMFGLVSAQARNQQTPAAALPNQGYNGLAKQSPPAFGLPALLGACPGCQQRLGVATSEGRSQPRGKGQQRSPSSLLAHLACVDGEDKRATRKAAFAQHIYASSGHSPEDPAQVAQGVQSRMLAPTLPSLRGCRPERAGTVLPGKSKGQPAARQPLVKPPRCPNPRAQQSWGRAGGAALVPSLLCEAAECLGSVVCPMGMRRNEGAVRRGECSSCFPLKSFTLQTLGEAQKPPGEEALHAQDSASIEAPPCSHEALPKSRCRLVFVSHVPGLWSTSRATIFQNLPDGATQSSIFESLRIETAQKLRQDVEQTHLQPHINKGTGGTANEMRRESGHQVNAGPVQCPEGTLLHEGHHLGLVLEDPRVFLEEKAKFEVTQHFG
ncbi:hypothetical protein Anapl_00535 [Anas platyrhynchos]|uniref:Uncharacterized protein n=1 Tax=Anas platyrhynchos TaxID=8839 RepID=R0K714_ANAPL|nr:hypothetical protein Anapl_00535 [Anas platyrhynchos]